MKTIFVILICLILSTVALGQADPVPAIEEVYLARDDGRGRAGEQVTEFYTGDVPIHCIILLDGYAKALVKMNFIAVRVAGVKPETKVVTASYATKDGQNRVNFTGRPVGKWPAGRYRVDLFVDGKLARNLEFEIKNGHASGKRTAVKGKPQ